MDKRPTDPKTILSSEGSGDRFARDTLVLRYKLADSYVADDNYSAPGSCAQTYVQKLQAALRDSQMVARAAWTAQ